MKYYPLTDMAVKMYCPNNVIQPDDAGLPSLLVYIPAFKNSDVLAGGDDKTHPAFIVNGEEIPGFYYSKYQNVVHNGKAYSLPGEDPHVSLKIDDAREYCEAKGYGWHLSTAAEWAAIALWCKANGFLPYGNNDYGKDAKESEYKAVPATYDSDGKISRVTTGTGPRTWSHDRTASGIWDLNGNVAEWQGGLRLVWGELQILADNDAADPENPQNETSTRWKAITAADGSLVAPECKPTDAVGKLSGTTVRLDNVGGVWTYSTEITSAQAASRSCSFSELTCTAAISDGAKSLLRALALLPDNGASASDYESAHLWANNGVKGVYAYRGGNWVSGVYSSIFSENLTVNYQYKDTRIGFRASYIPGII